MCETVVYSSSSFTHLTDVCLTFKNIRLSVIIILPKSPLAGWQECIQKEILNSEEGL